ncbi:ParB/RepB/Spo0J family partition protein [Paraburkholderia rhizosphaerae]|uniref:ParB/RepB/Spo0J family partition protein n=1 Tax=Paraburkholderia rhizosphaerae TaxID=480658 RepID=A0A4R8LN93_9BURK|nr:ParB/RepB/Spo0J family partition protein [Paraburkholderia rhizosphaerae]TDY47721.1 ParB/RepB/Spo0J family partition protein [Paraburkholderia rhizosphaerae]
MAAKTRKAAVAPLNGDVFPASDGPALQFVALDVIDMPEQVRTVFDEQSLAELAADVKVRGILQPVLLRTPVDGRYRFIAGERRIRAARIAGLTAVPALVGEVTEEAAEDMQLAENIQREELSLQDEARAIRRLYDRLKKVDRVADRVKKSSAWVSKRLALTYDDFDWRAKKLLEDGITEDVELLQCVAKVGELNQSHAAVLDMNIRQGNAGRKEARAVLAELKKPAARKVPSSSVPQEDSAAVQGEVSPPSTGKRGFDGRIALWELAENLRHEECPPVAELVNEFSSDQQTAILDVCRDGFEFGSSCAGLEALALVRRVAGLQASEHLEDWTLAAFTLGAFGMPFELGTLLAEVRIAIRNA